MEIRGEAKFSTSLPLWNKVWETGSTEQLQFTPIVSHLKDMFLTICLQWESNNGVTSNGAG